MVITSDAAIMIKTGSEVITYAKNRYHVRFKIEDQLLLHWPRLGTCNTCLRGSWIL